MHIRKFRPTDADQIAQLFHDTIRTVNLGDYSERQVQAWAPDHIHFQDWKTSCPSRYTVVAEERETILGFAQLEEDGYINCFYCHKNFQGQGIGKQLYQEIEKRAKRNHLSELIVEASITAKPFFEHLGFRVLKKQNVTLRGMEMINFRMIKRLEE